MVFESVSLIPTSGAAILAKDRKKMHRSRYTKAFDDPFDIDPAENKGSKRCQE
jgi:hypothetical protein